MAHLPKAVFTALYRIHFAANEENHAAVWLIEMEPNAELILPTADSSANRSLYCYQGGDDIYLDDREFGNGLTAKLNASEATVIKNGHETARFLILKLNQLENPLLNMNLSS